MKAKGGDGDHGWKEVTLIPVAAWISGLGLHKQKPRQRLLMPSAQTDLQEAVLFSPVQGCRTRISRNEVDEMSREPTIDRGEVTGAPLLKCPGPYMVWDACTRRNDNDEHGAPSPAFGSYLSPETMSLNGPLQGPLQGLGSLGFWAFESVPSAKPRKLPKFPLGALVGGYSLLPCSQSGGLISLRVVDRVALTAQ